MLFNIKPSAIFLITALATQFSTAIAVCASGQMAVGTSFFQMFTGPNGSFNVYSGFLMANNCGLISQNGSTQNENQFCKGGYNNGASVTCTNNKPTSAVDTVGQRWNCSPTNDQSCNEGGSGGRFTVLACCNRA
ncbi:hypothetical protein BDV93DRAFT_608276 [Ceratobasidium sp. AG-I]|nr:hypothetical protein BDV93DRAFT_608276 [Ceratobasidium sp. AG-I]